MTRRVEDYGGVRLHLPADADDQAWLDRVEAKRERMKAAYFSDAGTGKFVDRTRAAVSVADAAKAAGLDPEDMQNRLLGRAKLGVNAGEIVVRLSDLDRLGREGVIPTPGEAERIRRVSETVEQGGTTADPAVEDRTARAAAAIGLDLAEVRIKAEPSAADRRAAEVAKQIGLDYPTDDR